MTKNALTATSGLVHSVPDIRASTARALPAFMLALVNDHVQSHGYNVRGDMVTLTQREVREAVKDLDEITRRVVTDRASEAATKIMNAAGCNDAKQLWVATAHAILAAAQKGAWFSENVLLVAAGIETEINEDVGGDPSEFGGLRQIGQWSGRIENEAVRGGWWVLDPKKNGH